MRGKSARECRKPLISPRNSTLESPRGRDARAPRSTAPCGRDARAPRSTAPCGRDARAPRRTARVMNEHWWIMQSVLRDLDMENAIPGIGKDEGCRHVRMPKTDHVFT
jgi:hypothetical protein